MEEFLISLGKALYYGGFFRTTDGLPPQDWQFYGIGLYLFVLFCVSCGMAVVAGIAYLVKRRTKNE